jgi:hypothetical protein
MGKPAHAYDTWGSLPVPQAALRMLSGFLFFPSAGENYDRDRDIGALIAIGKLNVWLI